MSTLLTLDPIAFEIFGWPIRWYAIFITSGMVISLILATYEAKRRGYSSDLVLELFMWAVPIAVILARIVYVLAHGNSYFPIETKQDFFELFMINHGGLTIIGGIIGGVIGALIVSRIRKINLIDITDFGLPFLLLGQALGRWGNYVNQEAFGHVVHSEFFQQFPLGVYIERLGTWHYATFFYEMVLNIIGFALLYILSRKIKKRGVITVGYFIWYGMVRGLMEFLREDAVIANGIYITQVGSFIAAGIGIVILILILKDVIKTGYRSDIVTNDNSKLKVDTIDTEIKEAKTVEKDKEIKDTKDAKDNSKKKE